MLATGSACHVVCAWVRRGVSPMCHMVNFCADCQPVVGTNLQMHVISNRAIHVQASLAEQVVCLML